MRSKTLPTSKTNAKTNIPTERRPSKNRKSKNLDGSSKDSKSKSDSSNANKLEASNNSDSNFPDKNTKKASETRKRIPKTKPDTPFPSDEIEETPFESDLETVMG